MAKKDKPQGYGVRLVSAPSERLDEKPERGTEFLATIRIRVKGFVEEEMAQGLVNDVKFKILEFELGEKVTPRPDNPNQTSIDDAATPDADPAAGDFTG